MPPAGFEPTISPGERSHYALDCVATWAGLLIHTQHTKHDTTGNMLRITDFLKNIYLNSFQADLQKLNKRVAVLWNVTPCNPDKCNEVSEDSISSITKISFITLPSETAVHIYQTTRSHIPIFTVIATITFNLIHTCTFLNSERIDSPLSANCLSRYLLHELWHACVHNLQAICEAIKVSFYILAV
jgi:hypothetical protein